MGSELRRAVANVPSYMVVLAVMVIIGVLAAGVASRLTLPYAKQKGYPGGVLRHYYEVQGDVVKIYLVNTGDYDTKADVSIITGSSGAISTCLTPDGETVSLTGVLVPSGQTVVLECSAPSSDVRDVFVNEYGISSGETGTAAIGSIGAGISYGSGGISLTLPQATVVGGGPGYYIDVTVYGVGEDLRDFAYPVRLTGRPDVDWNVFDPATVYVVEMPGGTPLYYYVLQEDTVYATETVVWVKIPFLAANGVYRFRIYYGGSNPYSQYHDPDRVFAFFDDFSQDPYSSGKWSIYTTRGTVSHDSANGVVYLPVGSSNNGVRMYMNIDWRRNFHVHIRYLASGSFEGLTLFFFKAQPRSGSKVSSGSTLGLDDYTTVLVKNPGYAVEVDLSYSSLRDRRIPHIAFVETFSSPNVGDNVHYGKKRVTYSLVKGWHVLDIYYYGGVLEVYLDYNLRVAAVDVSQVISRYGVRYGGIGISASSGGWAGTGNAGLDTVFLRYFPGSGSDPASTLIGNIPGKTMVIYDFETDTVNCYAPATGQYRCDFSSGFYYIAYRTAGGYYGAGLDPDAYSGLKALKGVIGKKRWVNAWRAFTAAIYFPTPLSDNIDFYYKMIVAKSWSPRYRVDVQALDPATGRWVNLLRLSPTSSYSVVSLSGLSGYDGLRIYMWTYVYWVSRLRHYVLLDFWLDYVVYS